MQAIRVNDASQMTREEWLKARKAGIGGSAIAAIMGKNPYDTPLGVYLTTLGMIPEKEQTEAMYFGVVLEDFVAQEFSRRTGLSVERETFMLQHSAYGFMLANIDRTVIDEENGNGVLECKNVSAYQSDVWKEGAPEHYVYQLQWYLGITGYEYGYIAALCGGQKFYIYRYDRDDALIEEMYRAAADFWFNHVLEQVPPPVTENDGSVLGEWHAETDSSMYVELGEERRWMVQKVARNRLEMDAAEDAYDLSVNELKAIMGPAEILSIDGEVVATWKANKKGVRSFKLAGNKNE